MALSRCMAGPFIFVLLLVVAAEMGTARVVAEEKHCLSQSHDFKGMCINSDNCDNICKTEKFSGGECKMQGVTRKCFCKQVC